jgi:geranylgeranyl diphosphate synthase type II
MEQNPTDKIEKVLSIYKACGIDAWANQLKEQYLQTALKHLEDIAVLAIRKYPLKELADFLIQREV